MCSWLADAMGRTLGKNSEIPKRQGSKPDYQRMHSTKYHRSGSLIMHRRKIGCWIKNHGKLWAKRTTKSEDSCQGDLLKIWINGMNGIKKLWRFKAWWFEWYQKEKKLFVQHTWKRSRRKRAKRDDPRFRFSEPKRKARQSSDTIPESCQRGDHKNIGFMFGCCELTAELWRMWAKKLGVEIRRQAPTAVNMVCK